MAIYIQKIKSLYIIEDSLAFIFMLYININKLHLKWETQEIDFGDGTCWNMLGNWIKEIV